MPPSGPQPDPVLDAPRPIPRLFLLFFAVDLFLVAAYAACFSLGDENSGLIWLFDLDDEENIPTWFSSMQLMLTGAFWAILAFQRFERAAWRSWMLWSPAAFFTGLSFDEFAEIHERIGLMKDWRLTAREWAADPLAGRGGWIVLILAAGFVFSVLAAVSFKRYLWGRWAALLPQFIGLLIIVASEIGYQALDAVASNDRFTRSFIAQEIVDDGAKLFGETFFVWGAYRLLQAYGVSLFAADVSLDIRGGRASERERKP